MKYLQLFENTPSMGNAEVQFTTKNQKLDELRDQINGLLSSVGDKRVGYNYSVGSKGIYYTTSDGQLVTETGFACTTYSELLSNLEVILFTLKHINANPISVGEGPIEVLPPAEPTNDIKPEIQPEIQTDNGVYFGDFEIPELKVINIPLSGGADVERFESFCKP